MKTILILIIISFSSTIVYSQYGGTLSFPFLDLDYGARSSGLGGNFIFAKDGDLNLGITNPSLLNSEMNNKVALNQSFHAGGINIGMVSYGRSLKNDRFFTGHLRYVSYGKMQGRDINGEPTSTFNPFDYIIGVGFGQQLNPRISVGGNVNFIGSNLETYSSYGAAIDLGGTYTSASEQLLVTALVRNAGMQFNAYNIEKHPLPANFILGASYKLEHAPIRFSLQAHHLNKWEIAFDDPKQLASVDPLSGDIIPADRPNFWNKLGQHFSYHVEILPSKLIHLRAGFNYYQRQSLKVESRPGIAGFSFGTGLNFKRFSLDYGFTVYSRAGFNHSIGLSAHLDKIKK